MIKKFLMKKALQSQLKNVPKDQQELIMKLAEKKPELLETVAKEMQAEMKAGKPQHAAMMSVMMKHKDELQEVMGPIMQQMGMNPQQKGGWPR